jgi:hypothetical protein
MSGSVLAQTMPGDLEVGGGVRWVGGMSLGKTDATETSSSGGTFTLFASESELTAANAVEARLGVGLTRTLRVEVGGAYATSDLRTRISSDVEGIPDVTASERVQQFAIEGVVVKELTAWRLGTRTLPFASAGGGYLRHLHEGKTLVETGGFWHVGGGAHVVLRSEPDALMKAAGLRVDARAVFRHGGAAFDSRAHASPSLAASLFARF